MSLQAAHVCVCVCVCMQYTSTHLHTHLHTHTHTREHLVADINQSLHRGLVRVVSHDPVNIGCTIASAAPRRPRQLLRPGAVGACVEWAYIYLRTYMCVCVCVCVCLYTHTVG